MSGKKEKMEKESQWFYLAKTRIDCHAEWSKSKRENQIPYISTYM